MQIIAHRINTVAGLRNLDSRLGVEIDVRAWTNELILNHEAFETGDLLEDFLKAAGRDRFIIFNIKEAGIESRVHAMAARYGVKDYFLLDVEFPYLYRAARSGERRIAIRFSEDESLETVLKYKGLLDWVWIDTITKLPLNPSVAKQLQGFKLCLVCPERWGRPEDIGKYRQELANLGLAIDAVMTSTKHVSDWDL